MHDVTKLSLKPSYDAEGRIASTSNSANGQWCDTYNADGQRVRKTQVIQGTCAQPAQSNAWDFLYDLSGHQVAMVDSHGVWNRGEVYVGGRHLATCNFGTTLFMHSDWLGTERVRTSVSGSTYQTCTSLPFGDWYSCSGTDASPMHFTGKEHASESNVDNFGARYYTPSMGRFMTADPFGGSLLKPQSLNRYAYALNDPCNQIDPFGLKSTCKLNLKIQTAGDVTLSEAEKAAITNRINSLLASAQLPDRDGVQVQPSYSGEADYTLKFGPSVIKIEAQYLLGKIKLGDGVIGGANGNVYPDAVHFASFIAGGRMSQLMLLGGVAAHELVHMAGRFADEPYSILNENTMMQDDLSKDLSDKMFSNANSALWMITPPQLQAMFLACTAKHPEQKPPKRRGGGGGGNWNSGGFNVDCYSIGSPENTQTFCSITAGGGGFGGGRGGTVR